MRQTVNKILWGIFSLSPLFMLLIIFFIIQPLATHIRVEQGITGLNYIDISYFTFGNLYILFVIIAFIIALNKVEAIPNSKRTAWRVFIVLGHVLTIPLFWYLFIFKSRNR